MYWNHIFAPKISLNSKPHVLASIKNSFEVDWLIFKNFTAILVCLIRETFGDRKVDFFQFQGLKIIVNPDVRAKNQYTFKAAFVGFNMKHFSGK